MVRLRQLCLGLSASLTVAHNPVTQFLSNGRITGTSFGLPGVNQTYDYVIVGGGLAGSVVATRLSEQLPDDTIAVIEAGTFSELGNTNYSQIPFYSEQSAGASVTDFNPLIDWGLITEPQGGLDGRRLHYAQGRALGGSSIRNQMIYHRGTIGTYERFAEEVGDDAYLWQNMLPHFKKTFQFSLPNNEYRFPNSTPNYTISAYDYPGGGVHVSFPNYANPPSTFGPAALTSLGFLPNQDFSSGKLEGWGYFPSTIDPKSGLRSSAESGLLSPAVAKANKVSIYNLCQVKNILFDGQKRAKGVNVTVMGTHSFVLSARKEVIVSAGAWHSPQLLMVSGIGPKATLDKFEIPVLSALEGVGQGAWDTHNTGGVSYRTNTTSTSRYSKPGPELDVAEQEFLANGTGPLTNIGEDFWLWTKIPENLRANFSQSTKDAFARFPADWPEFEFVFTSSSRALTFDTSHGDYSSVGALMVASTSRGNMTIQSRDNAMPPIISPNWLLSKEDQEMAVAGIKQARLIVQAMGNNLGEVAPGPNITSDAQILEYVQRKGGSVIHHCTALCKMGKANDTMAVVDSKARVLGVTGLRVIDSSSLPFTNPGHTQGQTYAHAEKLAQDVIEAARQS